MEIKIKKVDKRAINPIVNDSTVLELSCISKKHSHKYIEYRTGLSIFIPKGYAGFLFPMDNVYYKDLTIKDSIGIVDSSNNNEIKIKFSTTDETLPNIYKVGEKIARLVILPVADLEYTFITE